jgi:hypothetical protein
MENNLMEYSKGCLIEKCFDQICTIGKCKMQAVKCQEETPCILNRLK